MSTTRFFLGLVPVDAMTLSDAVRAVELLVQSGSGGAVYTPNVDHVMLVEHDVALRDAYAHVDLSLPDGMPVVWGARLLGHQVPERVSGSDLLIPVLEMAALKGLGVYFFGADDVTLTRAQAVLASKSPSVRVCGTACPRVDLGCDDVQFEAWCAPIRASHAQLVIVALGAPKQELFIARARKRLPEVVFLALGAALEFVAGTQTRAPHWMQRSGLEWAFRLGREPRRLAHRYLVRDAGYPLVLWRAWRASRHAD